MKNHNKKNGLYWESEIKFGWRFFLFRRDNSRWNKTKKNQENSYKSIQLGTIGWIIFVTIALLLPELWWQLVRHARLADDLLLASD